MTDLHPLELPDTDWHAWLDARVDAQLAEARRVLDEVKDGSARDASTVLARWNDADIALRGADSLAGLVSEVHPDPAVRELAEQRAQEIAKVLTERGLDRELYAVVDATDPDALGDDADALRLREHVLRDFRRSGVDQGDDVMARLREISERLTVLDQDFSRVIRDDVRSIRITPDRLAGLPQDFVDAHEPDDEGLVTITTDYPDWLPFRSFARDAAARLELATAFLNRGWPDNDAVLQEMFALRDEQARILGYRTWPDYDTDVKMIGTSDAVAEFIERIADAAEPSGRRDAAILLERRRRDEPDADGLDAASTSYYSELIRRERFEVDAQEVRRYFDFAKVRTGLLEVTGRLFGIEYVPVDVPTWHADVASYDVLVDGVRAGRIHLDLHPREGKFKHAAQFELASGITGRQLAEGVLVCNFPTGLMQHTDVVTLFHEFGHLVHHVLGGDQRWARFSGVATEWDFVEAPSQMLEEWAWDADVLQTFATDADGTPIPRELVQRMRAANDFGKGLFVRNQIFYTALSYEAHRDRPADLTERVRLLQERYDLNRYLEGTHFHASFGHLGGYTSAYYTYMWSLVIAKDLFAAFDPGDLFAPEVAHRYRDRILAQGGRRDAADLVADFLGRPFDFAAFAAWLDRAPEVAAGHS
ncbi:thimet oligopeptidase [Jatrophihabitans endophyticus]|uniref:Thimet oligopeptidase n=1 Tax=Jatrophihabitans endophyticus TaxID=1206085 RepID=A0A1M5UPA3_9ACTN|nr:M3 family metallopeptidase [Jatrophihabitans endophyticus]SHH64789.1 thimet oligopeptidase [Jatrophihabitans endophyticus]